MAQYSAQEICEAFNRTNEKATWSARPNSRDTADLAIFHSPSDLIEISYDAIKGRFNVRFVKAQAPFRTYMLAISKAFSYVLECLAAGGLPFAPPAKPSEVEVRCALSEKGDVVTAWWDGMRPAKGAEEQWPMADWHPDHEIISDQPENSSESS